MRAYNIEFAIPAVAMVAASIGRKAATHADIAAAWASKLTGRMQRLALDCTVANAHHNAAVAVNRWRVS